MVACEIDLISPAPVVTYSYDPAGRLTSALDTTSTAITPATPPGGTPVQYAATYGYDVMNRPTGVSWSPAPTAAAPIASSVSFSHSYNQANQRIGQTISDNSWVNYPAATPGTVSYTADALNRYTAVGAVSPTYDTNGNLTSDGTFTFGYDTENRLISATGAGSTISYAYDARGRRKMRTVNGLKTVFVTDADNREVLEYSGSSGAIQRWYAYGLGPKEVLNQMNIQAGTRTTLIPDILGSIIATRDSNLGGLTKVGYLPYGKSASTGPFGFTGQRIDPETGLYYYRARHYSPAWGRFLQVDPLGGPTDISQISIAGTDSRFNLYAYVGNDPLNKLDSNGLFTLSLGLGYSLYAGGGGEVSFGLAISFPVPYLDPTAKFDVGSYFSAGGGVGANVGSTLQLGAYSGDIMNGGLAGPLVNTGVGAGPIGVQASFSQSTGNFVGGTLSFGPRAPIPLFGNTSITNTSVNSLRQDITNLLK